MRICSPTRGLGRAALAAWLLLAGVSNAHADESAIDYEYEDDLSWGWNAFAAFHSFSDESRLGNGEQSSIAGALMVGARLFYPMGDWATVEGELPVGISNSRDDRATLFVSMPRVHGRLRPFGDAGVSPSVLAGVGAPLVTSTRQSSVPSDIQPAIYAGLGLGMKFEGLRLGLEGRYIALRAEEGYVPASDWEVLLTFELRRKKVRQAPPPPPPDVDRDGVEDSLDACPNRPEDLDGFEDSDGCPELDNDRDGVIDGLDRCQGEAETFNGFEDDDGCPDQITDEVRLVEGAIAGLRFDAGSGVMEELGLEELDKLAETLKANPSIKIKLYGYTDDREAADAESLEAIAQERADSVRQYLIEKGVGHGRIKAFARGNQDYFADNETASGRRANRRVEVALDRDDEEEAK